MRDFIDESKRRKLDRPFTGKISEDRIWEQWYSEEAMKSKLPKMNEKDYLFSRIGDQPGRIILNNRGMRKYSVADFERLIYQYECAFVANGLGKGDRICTIGLSTPELYAIKYAAHALGIITCNLNVLDAGKTNDHGENVLLNRIKEINPKMLFVLDYLESKIYNIINNPEIDEITKVSMPLDASVPFIYPEKHLLNLKNWKDAKDGKAITKKISLRDFLNKGKTLSKEQINEVYAPGLPSNIAFTSGTTGANKAVLLSHDATNALAFQQEIADFGFKVGSKHLAVLPPFLAFWDADIVHVTLCLGAQNNLELTCDYKDIPKYFKKYGNVDIGIWPQSLWLSLLTELTPEERKKYVSKDLIAIIGGTRCEINPAETFYNETGVVQLTGYGASEVSTTFSVTHPHCNKVGSCGLPLPFNNVRILDPNGKDLSYNQPGQLLISSPCLMNGYYGRPDLTEKVFRVDETGKWYITGDYATMDTDGCLTVLDRYLDPIVISSKGKQEEVQLLDVVEKIKTDRNIKLCKLTFNGGKLILHLSIDTFTGLDPEDAKNSIIETIKAQLDEKYWPDIIQIYDELPKTSVGKIDPEALEEEGEKLVQDCVSEEKLYIVDKTKDMMKLSRKK